MVLIFVCAFSFFDCLVIALHSDFCFFFLSLFILLFSEGLQLMMYRTNMFLVLNLFSYFDSFYFFFLFYFRWHFLSFF